ncbi:MAG: GNAT family N-acetyltransferase [Deltaproteobacteria bacterium]|nr:GNAT family N-acetyltransferase [Deltaproteobacteria bacterium]
MRILDARPEHRLALRDGNVAMAHETEAVALDPARVLRGVDAVLADPAKGFYLVAELDGAYAGQLMVTYEWSDWRDGTQWWIQSVWVPPEHRRRGVYRALHEAVVTRARAAGAVGVRLYVADTNARAMATYAALGMEDAGYRVFELELPPGPPGEPGGAPKARGAES